MIVFVLAVDFWDEMAEEFNNRQIGIFSTSGKAREKMTEVINSDVFTGMKTSYGIAKVEIDGEPIEIHSYDEKGNFRYGRLIKRKEVIL